MKPGKKAETLADLGLSGVLEHTEAVAAFKETLHHSAVWSTSDGGATWRELGGPSQEMNLIESVDSLDARHVVVGGDGMWFSTDGGKHWRTCIVTAAGKTGQQSAVPMGLPSAV